MKRTKGKERGCVLALGRRRTLPRLHGGPWTQAAAVILSLPSLGYTS